MVAEGIGFQVTPSTTAPIVALPQQTPVKVQDPQATLTRLDKLESLMSNLANTVNTLAQGQTQLANTLQQLTSTVHTLAQVVAATSGVPSNGSNGSSSISMSLAAHIPEDVTITHPTLPDSIEISPGSPVTKGFKRFWTYIPAIHADGFWEQLETLLLGLSSDEKQLFSVIIQPEFTSGQRRTLGKSFHTNCKPNMIHLREALLPLIENFEEQSGGGSVGGFTNRTYIIITDITGLPEPELIHWSASPSNMNYATKVRKEQKAAAKGQITNARVWESISSFESSVNGLSQAVLTISQGQTNILQTMQAQTNAILETIKVQSTSPSINWAPLIQAVATAIPAVVGVPVTPISTATAPGEAQVPPAIHARIDKLESTLDTLATSVAQQGKSFNN